MNEEATNALSTADIEKQFGDKVEFMEAMAENLLVEDEVGYALAGGFAKDLKRKAAQISEYWKPLKEKAHQAHKEICEREKEMLAPLANAEKIVKSKMSAYVTEIERKRKEQEEAIRKAAEEERDRMLLEAVKHETAGDVQAAESAMEEAVVMDEATRYVIPEANAPKVSGVITSKDWEITSVDPSKVPVWFGNEELRPVDMKAVIRLIRSSKGSISIPGVEYKAITKISYRR